jgi:hypothetical protein
MVTANGLNDAKARTTVSLYLKDSALRWYISLEDDFKGGLPLFLHFNISPPKYKREHLRCFEVYLIMHSN